MQQVVGGGFQQDVGQVYGICGWCLGVGVWQLGVYWYYWEFYCEGDEEIQYQQVFGVWCQFGFQQVGVVEGQYVGLVS